MLIAMKIYHLLLSVSLSLLYLSSYQQSFFAAINSQKKISFRWCCGMKHVISIFMDAFQGHYKDGTNGTYDLRFMAGLYLILRIVIVYVTHRYIPLTKNASPRQMLYYFFVTVIVTFMRPYKRFIHNLTETSLLVLIVIVVRNASAFERISYSKEDRIKVAVIQLIPHFFLVMVIAFKVIKLLLQKLKLQYKTQLFIDKLRPHTLNKIWSRLRINDEELSSLTDAKLPQHTYGAIN